MQLGCNKGMWGVPWRDVDLKESSEYSADYKGIPLSLEVCVIDVQQSIMVVYFRCVYAVVG